MRKMLFLLFFVTTIVAWCMPSFALVQTVNSNQKLDADGVSSGANITNVSTLTVDGTGGFANIGNTAGVSVSTTAANQGAVVFSTNSVVSGNMGAVVNVLDEIDVNAGATTVDFNGTVFTRIMKVAGGTTAKFNSGTLGAAGNKGAIDFTGDGTINVAANTSVTGALTNNGAGAQLGTLNLYGATAGTDQWNGQVGTATGGLKSINVVGGSNTAGITSQITGAVDTYNLNLATNTLNIIGTLNVRNGAGGAINTTLASSSVFGHIVETGAATLTGAQTLNVTVPTASYIPLGTLFNIINATSITNSIVPTIITVNGTNPLYTFVVEPITGTTAGKLTIKTTGTPIKPAIPSANFAAPLAAAVADALLTLPVASPVVAAINALTTADAVANAEAQLAPSTPSLAAPLVTYQGIRAFQDLWLSRLDGCGQVSWPSEDKENCKGKNASSGWWLKGFGYFGEQDARGAFTQYNSTIIGSMLAYDVPVGLNTRAGVGFGYARTAIKGSTFDARTDFDTYQGLAYIGHEAGLWFVDASGSFGWNQYQDKRHIQFPGTDLTARSKYSGQDYTAFARTGYHFPIQKFTFTPMASLQYSRVNVAGHTEREAGDVNMNVKSQHYDYLESGLGAKVERNFTFNKYTLVPDAHFEWLHKLSNPRLAQTAAYTPAGSSSFTTPGLRTVADSYHVGTGITLLSCSCSATTWSVEGGYDYYWRTDGYAANQVSMRVSRLF